MKIWTEAKEHLVGGVSSPVRAFDYVGGAPLLMERGKGSKVYDRAGKEYVDYVLSFGALILGHAWPGVVRDTQRRLRKGAAFGTTTGIEVGLAAAIKKAVPGMRKLRFVNSGTEAVMSAVRLARGYTHRDKIIKFAGSYHGHADQFLAGSGSGLASLSIPVSAGVPADFIKHTIVARYGDTDGIDRVLARHGKRTAAVIVEPAGGNYGVIPPDRDFLEHLRRVTERHGVLLIFDEVITGFRTSYGTLGDELGIRPDLTCLGKIIGGGLPVGAYGGKEEIMNRLAPVGDVYQASTFAGNPVVMQAGLSTLETLYRLKDVYGRQAARTEELARYVREEAERKGVELEVSAYGTMFSFRFGDRERFRTFYRRLISEGVYTAPSEYEANFVSFAHTKADIENTKKAMKRALR